MDKFRLIRDLSRELASTLELGELAKAVNRFSVVELGAEHSSVMLWDGRRFPYREDGEVFCGVDRELLRYALSVGRVLRVASPPSEFMFRGIRGIDSFALSAMSFPLAAKGQALGSLNLYFKKMPDDGMEDFISFFAELSSSSIMNSLSYTSLEATSMTDKLTGLRNRRCFDMQAGRIIESCASSGIPNSVMMLDIDGFKEYNDSKGHQEGDSALESIGKAVKAAVGESCAAYRYGGEELAVVLPRAKPEIAFEAAEKIRKAVEQSCRVTVSIGVASCLNSSCSLSVMVGEADKALYRAKKAGKNRVCASVIIDRSLSPIDVQAASELGRK